MVEITFSESAAGSLSLADCNKKNIDKISSAIIIGTDKKDQTLNQEEMQRMIRESEERERSNWEKAIPLKIENKDILCFPVALSIGDITENVIGEQRKSVLQKLVSIYPDNVKPAAMDMFNTAQKNLKELLCRAEKGETIRIWTSDTPDEACGFYWLIEKLKPLGFENLDITYVKLPDFHIMPDGTVVIYSGWGEVAPHQLGNLSRLEHKLPVNYMHALSFRWQQLKKENAPLRAVINRQLVSVRETFYDPFILRELDDQNDEFMEANLIGKVIGKYSIGISDSLIALRIDSFINDGMLKPITQAKPEDPSYHRMLRKIDSLGQ